MKSKDKTRIQNEYLEKKLTPHHGAMLRPFGGATPKPSACLLDMKYISRPTAPEAPSAPMAPKTPSSESATCESRRADRRENSVNTSLNAHREDGTRKPEGKLKPLKPLEPLQPLQPAKPLGSKKPKK